MIGKATSNVCNRIQVFYLCDRKACDNCSWPTCKHTSNPRHAIHLGQIITEKSFSLEVIPERCGNNNIFLIEKEEENAEEEKE
jgi:hypothetical protein